MAGGKKTEVGNPIQGCPLVQGETNAEPAKEGNHFINFILSDDKGKPLDNITLRVVFPDKVTSEERKSGESGKPGLIEIKNIKQGQFKIESDWRQLTIDEVVFLNKW